MEKETLKKSPVVFDKERHTYELRGSILKGVTPIVKWMFPETYRDIPEEVLNKAAEYGSLIHSKIELADTVGIVDDECKPLMDYIALKEKYGLTTHSNEFLVDDGFAIASSIDLVFDKNMAGEYPLADIKTTSSIHVNNVTLQLSIYAMLFEAQTGQKAGELFVVWLPKPQYGEATLMELQRIDSETCNKIVQAYLNGEEKEQFDYLWNGGTAPELVDETLPANLADVEAEIIRIEEQQKAMEERKNELRAGLLKLMEEHGVKKWQSERLVITRKAATTRISIDSAKLKKSYPDIYDECAKISEVKANIMIKVL